MKLHRSDGTLMYYRNIRQAISRLQIKEPDSTVQMGSHHGKQVRTHVDAIGSGRMSQSRRLFVGLF